MERQRIRRQRLASVRAQGLLKPLRWRISFMDDCRHISQDKRRFRGVLRPYIRGCSVPDWME